MRTQEQMPRVYKKAMMMMRRKGEGRSISYQSSMMFKTGIIATRVEDVDLELEGSRRGEKREWRYSQVN